MTTKTNFDNSEVTVRRHRGTGLLTAEFCAKKGNMGLLFLVKDEAQAILKAEAIDKMMKKKMGATKR